MERITWGKMQNPVRGVLHGVAAIAALVGLWVLIDRSDGSAEARIGVLIFGTALVAMFTISAIYHSTPWSEPWRRRMQRIDHSLIFAVVAGTFTPVAMVSLEGPAQVAALGLVWGIAVVGVVLKFALPDTRTMLSVGLQMAMGWSALVWLPWFLADLGWEAVLLILAGGACYTVGTVFFATKRPRLFPRVFSYHEVFHVLVVAGSSLHWLAIARYAV